MGALTAQENKITISMIGADENCKKVSAEHCILV